MLGKEHSGQKSKCKGPEAWWREQGVVGGRVGRGGSETQRPMQKGTKGSQRQERQSRPACTGHGEPSGPAPGVALLHHQARIKCLLYAWSVPGAGYPLRLGVSWGHWPSVAVVTKGAGRTPAARSRPASG